MPTADELIQQKEQVAHDKSLFPEERKKKLRQIRKALRKASGHVVQHRDASEIMGEAIKVKKAKNTAASVDFGELKKAVEDKVRSLKLPQANPKENVGYTFPLKVMAAEGVSDPQAFFNKFHQRWGFEPQWYFFIPVKTDVFFGLGPVGEIEYSKGK